MTTIHVDRRDVLAALHQRGRDKPALGAIVIAPDTVERIMADFILAEPAASISGLPYGFAVFRPGVQFDDSRAMS